MGEGTYVHENGGERRRPCTDGPSCRRPSNRCSAPWPVDPHAADKSKPCLNPVLVLCRAGPTNAAISLTVQLKTKLSKIDRQTGRTDVGMRIPSVHHSFVRSFVRPTARRYDTKRELSTISTLGNGDAHIPPQETPVTPKRRAQPRIDWRRDCRHIYTLSEAVMGMGVLSTL